MGLDGVEFIMEVEDAFSIRIPDDALRGFDTLGHVLDHVVAAVQMRGEAAHAGRIWSRLAEIARDQVGADDARIVPGARLTELGLG